MHIDLVNPALNATSFANAPTQIMYMQMPKQICIHNMLINACVNYFLQCISQVEPDYMKSTAATHLYVDRWPPHTNTHRHNKGKMPSADY